MPRWVNYVLFTAKDFSSNHDTIRFRLLMKSGNQVLLDSPLAPMTIAQIPDSNHWLYIQKNVPSANLKDDLLVGFLYSIDNVGSSWYLDSFKVGNPAKDMKYSFQ